MSKEQMQTTHNTCHTHLKNNPFDVPVGYFNLLSQQVGLQIDQKSTPKRRTVYKAQLTLAASFVLMIGIGYGIVRLITPNIGDTEPFDTDHLSLFKTYTLLQNDEWEETLDAELIISFLTDHGISPYTIAALE